MKESLVKPKTLSDAESAALPLTAITAWEGLFERLGIDYNKKDTNSFKNILIIGGAGGVGSIAIQLAKWAGLNVITTASRNETIHWVKNLVLIISLTITNLYKIKY